VQDELTKQQRLVEQLRGQVAAGEAAAKAAEVERVEGHQRAAIAETTAEGLEELEARVAGELAATRAALEQRSVAAAALQEQLRMEQARRPPTPAHPRVYAQGRSQTNPLKEISDGSCCF
jgi:hypothetical protein